MVFFVPGSVNKSIKPTEHGVVFNNLTDILLAFSVAKALKVKLKNHMFINFNLDVDSYNNLNSLLSFEVGYFRLYDGKYPTPVLYGLVDPHGDYRNSSSELLICSQITPLFPRMLTFNWANDAWGNSNFENFKKSEYFYNVIGIWLVLKIENVNIPICQLNLTPELINLVDLELINLGELCLSNDTDYNLLDYKVTLR